jgi:hypothetical protein
MKIKEIIKNNPKATKKELCILTGLSLYKLNKVLVTYKPNRPKKSKLTKKQKSNDNAYTNKAGIKKEQGRELIREEVILSNIFDGTILTLPSDNCIMEGKLNEDVSDKFDFVGVEFTKSVYNRMLQQVAKKNLPFKSCVHAPIGDVIAVAKENDYSHLILDYCGQLGTYHKDIEMALNNKIVRVGGVVALTLNRRGRGELIDSMMELNPLGNVKNKMVENAIITYLMKLCGYNYSIEKVFPYADKGKDNMILIIMKRIK